MTFKSAADQFVADQPLIHLFVHGLASQTVPTENGNIKTLAKLVADAQAAVSQAITGTYTGNRVIVSSAGGAATTDPGLLYNIATGLLTVGGNVQVAAPNGITFNGSTDAGSYGIAFKNDGVAFPIRVALASDSGVHRHFQVGYYSTDVQTGAWSSALDVDGYTGATAVKGGLTVSSGGIVVNGGTLAYNVDGTHTIGTAAVSALVGLRIKGGSNSGKGGYTAYDRGAGDNFYVGNEAALILNASNNGALYAIAGIDFFTNNDITPRVVIDAAGLLTANNGVTIASGQPLTVGGPATFAGVGTTASAANAFLDGAASNNLLRSTSRRAYKDILGLLAPDAARDIVMKSEAVVFHSKASADWNGEEFLGFVAEQIASVDRRLITLDKKGDPDWVQYASFVVPHNVMLQDHERRLAALEARLN